MKKLLLAPLALLLLIPASASADQVKVMSRNLYLGADLLPLAVYGSDKSKLGPFTQAATGVWGNVQKTDFNKRSRALALELKTHKPDIVGLQEAALWQRSKGKSGKANKTVYDYTKTLIRDAKKLGVNYRVVRSQDEFVFAVPTNKYMVKFTQRDVLLARTGAKITVSNPRSGRYSKIFTVQTPVGEAKSRRGWVSAKVKTPSGQTLTIFNTHLEAYGDPIRKSQAEQLAQQMDQTPGPVVLTGDLNSDPAAGGDQAQAAQVILGKGFSSAFPAPVPTCCQAELLNNQDSTLESWIDHILIRDLSSTGYGVVGNKQSDKVSGMWPSDHAGVWASLSLGD